MRGYNGFHKIEILSPAHLVYNMEAIMTTPTTIPCSLLINRHKIVKIQSLFRMRKWYLSIALNIIKKLKDNDKKKETPYTHEPTVFGDNSKEFIEKQRIAHEVRVKQMKEGLVAQILIGNWPGWQDLKTGDISKLDCRRSDGTIIMEIKNKYNTCNSGSGTSVQDNLANYKKQHPNTRCVLGIVNPKPATPTQLTCPELRQLCIQKNVPCGSNCRKADLMSRLKETGMTESDFVKTVLIEKRKKKLHKGEEIEIIEGPELFKLVFSIGKVDYSEQIISMVNYHRLHN
jgi:hypothetical protein